MFFQTDRKLQFKADSDCYLFDVLYGLEKVGKFKFTREQVKQLRAVSVRADFISEDGFLNEKGISGIAMVSSGLTGHHVYAKRVGSNDNYNVVIGKFMRVISPNNRMVHFNYMNFALPKIVEWDPWSEYGAKTTHEGNIIEYRYLFMEAI